MYNKYLDTTLFSIYINIYFSKTILQMPVSRKNKSMKKSSKTHKRKNVMKGGEGEEYEMTNMTNMTTTIIKLRKKIWLRQA